MDELELLKKDWQKKEVHFPVLSYNEIYKMIHAKSSSIVKWIFIISVIELSLGLILALINPSIESQVVFPQWVNILVYATYPIIIFFIYRFYTNYKTISATDSVKSLIANIIKTRKTVKYYVIFNLFFAAIIFATGLYIAFTTIPGGIDFSGEVSTKQYAVLIGAIILATALFIGFILGIYYLLYGLLLKRLNRNYKELKKLEA
ncbi:hypothetical protein [Ichthyenterobacterium magnum]|uniref:Uncharacterized protein n=1 Tax=Ichthyenterobacterium magnum TaxID=1230530 RepID=A0A420DGM3_9FLAO|nr:hypothetical protein [Ichthyenterobacterium magnum]RKE92233.1 hypothetical protein BXY80_2151 [Ichthyenterobacterium magnum]